MTTDAAVGESGAPRPSRFRLNAVDRRNARWGLFFISPWLIGFVLLTIYPILYTLYLSFTRYSGFGEARWIGAANYTRMAADPLFWKSAYNTLYYTLLAVPVGVVVAMVLALAMNTRVREVAVYRAAFYLPSILPVFALTFVFIVFLNPGYGLLNFVLETARLPSPDWLGDPAYTKLALVILAQMGAGQFALIFLAALRGIPAELYESAALDGAGVIKRFRHITLPMMTPVILYDIVIGLSLGLQIFTPAYLMSGGGASGGGAPGAGPDNSLLTYVFYLYKNAFQLSQMGYAAALSFVLFVVSVVLAIIVFKWAARWVYYEGA